MARPLLRKPFFSAGRAADDDAQNAPTRPTPLVPADSIAGRSLVIVIAIMTFLAALAAGAALLVSDASLEWRKEAAREIRVQIRATPGRDVDAEVRKALEVLEKTPGIQASRAYTKAESEALLAPWLGEGLDLSELPMPRMIVVTLEAGRRADLDQLKLDLAKASTAASLDDHRIFVARLGDMARAVVAVVLGVFALIVAAMAIAVATATRAAIDTNREIVEVLHIVGAANSYIAREFQRRFLALGFRGALLGGAAALAFFALAQVVTRRFTATPGGDQMEAIFGGFALGPEGYVLILALSGAIALLTGALSRRIVARRLGRMN
jgi:cell division transport system permease protein